MKLIKGMTLVIATHNPGKVPEIAALLDGNYKFVTAGELKLPEPEETEATFTGNAMLKARHAAALSGQVAIADDSGLSVAALELSDKDEQALRRAGLKPLQGQFGLSTAEQKSAIRRRKTRPSCYMPGGVA